MAKTASKAIVRHDEQVKDNAVDWLLRLRDLQAQGISFERALEIANSEVSN